MLLSAVRAALYGSQASRRLTVIPMYMEMTWGREGGERDREREGGREGGGRGRERGREGQRERGGRGRGRGREGGRGERGRGGGGKGGRERGGRKRGVNFNHTAPLIPIPSYLESACQRSPSSVPAVH